MSSTTSALHGNPFALLLDPTAVLAACKTSKPLSALRNAVHKPLDKPRVFLDTSAAEFDAAIDAGLPVSALLGSEQLVASQEAATVTSAPAPAKKRATTPAAHSKRRGPATAIAATAYAAEPADTREIVLSGRTR